MQKNQVSLDDFHVVIKDAQGFGLAKDEAVEVNSCRATTEITFSGGLNGLKMEQYETFYFIRLKDNGRSAVELENERRGYLTQLIMDYFYAKVEKYTNTVTIKEYTPLERTAQVGRGQPQLIGAK